MCRYARVGMGSTSGPSSHKGGTLRFDTAALHHTSRRAVQAAVDRRIKKICKTRVRYGCRRLHVLLRRKGWQVNINETRSIYNELALQFRNIHPKRRVKSQLRDDCQEAVRPYDV